MTDMTAEEIEALLGEARIGRLCMADANGRPYAIPLPFCWRDGALYLRLPFSGRKGLVLSQNPQVCFEVDTYTDTLDSYASVLIEGTLLEVTRLDEKLRVKAANDAKYSRLRQGHRPGHGRATALADLPMRKIVVESISGRCKESATTSPALVGEH